jgi:hypothetical protein
MKLLVLVNTLTSVSSFVYQNHIAFAAYFTRKHPKDELFWFAPHRQAIDTARNEAAKQALNLGCDYLMFIDDDVLIPTDAFDKLRAAKKDVIAGLVYLRGYPFHVMAFREIKAKVLDDHGNEVEDPRLKLTYYDEIHQLARERVEQVKCEAVGFSCCLIHCDVLRAMEPPYFVTGPLNTEDVYFCIKTRTLKPLPTIFLHTGVRCGHLLNPEPIEFETRTLLTDFYDNLARKFNDLTGAAEIDPNPRNIQYIERNIAKL